LVLRIILTEPGDRPAIFAATPVLEPVALLAGKTVHDNHPKTDIVVPVFWVVPVAIGHAGVVLIVVPRAAAQRRSLSLRPSKP